MGNEHIKTGISAGNGGEMGTDGHVAPGGEMASMPGGPPAPKKATERVENQNADRKNHEARKKKKAS